MIDGLKLTISGEQLRQLLETQTRRHVERAASWTHEQQRTADDQTEDAPLLPAHMCENEAERHQWRAEVLGFIRDHIEPGEIYRLSAGDLDFGELLPEKPESLSQHEYEDRTGVRFTLERLAKTLDGLIGMTHALFPMGGPLSGRTGPVQ